MKAWVVKLLGGLSAVGTLFIGFCTVGEWTYLQRKVLESVFCNCDHVAMWRLGSHVSRVLSAASQHARKSVVNVNSVVKLVGGTVQQLLCFKVDCEVTRSSSCLAAGYNRDGVVKLVGGAVQAVAVFKSDCLVLGLWMRGSNSVVKLLGGRVQFEWCCQVGCGTVLQLLCLKVTAR